MTSARLWFIEARSVCTVPDEAIIEKAEGWDAIYRWDRIDKEEDPEHLMKYYAKHHRKEAASFQFVFTSPSGQGMAWVENDV